MYFKSQEDQNLIMNAYDPNKNNQSFKNLSINDASLINRDTSLLFSYDQSLTKIE